LTGSAIVEPLTEREDDSIMLASIIAVLPFLSLYVLAVALLLTAGQVSHARARRRSSNAVRLFVDCELIDTATGKPFKRAVRVRGWRLAVARLLTANL
jgi:hypothetical protein